VVEERFLFISGMNPWVRVSYLWQAHPSRCWLGSVEWGEVISAVAEGSGGGKIDGLGWRSFRSRGYLVVIIAYIHGLFTVGGGLR